MARLCEFDLMDGQKFHPVQLHRHRNFLYSYKVSGRCPIYPPLARCYDSFQGPMLFASCGKPTWSSLGAHHGNGSFSCNRCCPFTAGRCRHLLQQAAGQPGAWHSRQCRRGRWRMGGDRQCQRRRIRPGIRAGLAVACHQLTPRQCTSSWRTSASVTTTCLEVRPAQYRQCMIGE